MRVHRLNPMMKRHLQAFFGLLPGGETESTQWFHPCFGKLDYGFLHPTGCILESNRALLADKETKKWPDKTREPCNRSL